MSLSRTASATKNPAAIEMAIRLLEAHHPPEKVEAALVYRGYSEAAARDLVQGILSGKVTEPAHEDDAQGPKNWATLPAPHLLTLGLVLLAVTVAGAVSTRVVFLWSLVAGLLMSCTGLQRLLGPKHHRLSTTLCAVLIVLATWVARFYHRSN